MTTNAQIVQLFTDVLARWNEREAEFRNWQAGTAEGGPNANGLYPLTNGSGETFLVACPAKLADTVSGPAVLSMAAQIAAETAQAAAETASTRADNSRAFADNHKAATLAARDLAFLYRDQCAAAQAAVSSFKAVVETKHDTVVAKAAEVEVFHGEVIAAKDDTLVAKAQAVAARDQAASFASSINPSALATKAELQTELAALVDAAPATLNTLNEIAAALGDDPNFATSMTSSLAGKAPLVHGHVVSDVSGLQTALDGKQPVGSYVTTVSYSWDNLPGKPASFPPSTHGHVIADVSGLQTVLDGKQPVGSYALTSHNHDAQYAALSHVHAISNITGLQAALDGKQAEGSYVTTAGFTWAALAGKPTEFTPAAHTHTIANITGLQSALDGKLSVVSGEINASRLDLGDTSKFIRGGGAGQVILGAGDVNSGYLQVGGSYYSLWNSGNFNPANYLPLTGGTLTGTLTSISLISAPAIRSPDISNQGSGVGYVSISQGNGTFTGYINFFNAAGVRQAYMGYAPTDGAFAFHGEGSTSFTFNKPVIVAGRNILNDIDGKASVGHTHAYLPLTGGTLTGSITAPDYRVAATAPFFLTGDEFRFRTTSGAERACIDTSGNVGIGVVPSTVFANRRTLQIANTGSSITGFTGGGLTELRNTTSLNAVGDEIYSITGAASKIVMNGNVISFSNAPSGTVATAATFTERMCIDSSGNVGIGTSSPISGAGLTVGNDGNGSGTVKYAFSTSTVERAFISLNGDSGEMRYSAGYAGYGGFSTFYTVGAERMRIAATGNVGIGTSSPSRKLHVDGDAQFRDVYASRGDGSGVVYLNTTQTRYLYWNGGAYFLPGADLNVNGVDVLATLNTKASNNRVDFLFNNSGQEHGFYQDFNVAGAAGHGFRFLQNTANGPGTGASQFYTFFQGLGANYGPDSYGMQVAMPRNSLGSAADKYLSFRLRENGAWQGWQKFSAGDSDKLGGIDAGKHLKHTTSGLNSGNITTSTAAPSGGVDGDIWLKVAS